MKPQQVERLALIAATPCFVRRDDWQAGLGSEVLQTFSAALARDVDATLDRFISLQAQSDRAAKHVIQKLRAVLASRARPALPVLERGLHILQDADLRAVLADLRQHTLVLHGEQDRLVPLSAATQLVNALSHARLEVIPGAGHAPFVSKAAPVARLLAEHFA
jgi:pimeloyl-[acyl-carrier protein] methyl ester esterase